MSVLLTGGAGYIGTHTAVALIEAGFEVVIADDFSNSKPEAVARIGKITGKQPAFYKIDVADKAALRDMFSKENIDSVIHLAGYKAVGESVQLPVKYYRNNIDTTLALIDVMKEFGVHNFVFSSSATVYGVPEFSPVPETAPVGACSNPYGKTKYFNEEILRDAAVADKDLSVVILRYFNPIGAHESGLIGEDPEGIPNNLMPYISQVAIGKREHLNVFGNDYNTHDGTGVRDYLHVVDLANGHIAAVKYACEHKGAEVFNLGTGVGYSVLDIVKAFEKSTGVKIPYVIAPRRAGDIDAYFGDPTKANTVLGWKAERTLEDMCADTYKWQSMNPSGY